LTLFKNFIIILFLNYKLYAHLEFKLQAFGLQASTLTNYTTGAAGSTQCYMSHANWVKDQQ